MLTHFSTFSGIGGIDLAAEWAGFRTIGQCELADYPYAVLCKHWPGVPKWRDIKTVDAGDVKRRTGIDSPTLLSGGFPCQPFSTAGKRRGKEDDRHLWPELFRVVRELRPAWFLGENVPGIIGMEFENCLADLESEGYGVRAFLVPACGVGAWHRRERVFIVAHAEERGAVPVQFPEQPYCIEQGCKDVSDPSIEGERGLSICERRSRQARYDTIGSGEDVADSRLDAEGGAYGSEGWEHPGRREEESGVERGRVGADSSDGNRIGATECRLGGVADGFSCWLDEPAGVPRVAKNQKNRVHRLRCLGNAVVPAQVFPFLRAIAEIESIKS